jgi:hypothetical protein
MNQITHWKKLEVLLAKTFSFSCQIIASMYWYQIIASTL